MKSLGKIYCLLWKCYHCVLMYVLLPLIRSHGKRVNIEPERSRFTFDTISIGTDVYIGPGAHFASTLSPITIGNKVRFGPYVRCRPR